MQIKMTHNLKEVSARLTKLKVVFKQQLADALQEAAEDEFVQPIKQALVDGEHVFKGDLINSIEARVRKGWLSVSLDVGSFDVEHAYGFTFGQNPGYQADENLLTEWVLHKRITNNADTARMIARNINVRFMEEGVEEHPIIPNIIKQNLKRFSTAVTRRLKSGG